MKLSDWLQSCTVEDIVLSKTKKTDMFYSVPSSSALIDVMWLLGTLDISAITIYETDSAETAEDTGQGCHWCSHPKRLYTKILTAADLLKHLFDALGSLSKNFEHDIKNIETECLQRPISDILHSKALASRTQPIFVSMSDNLVRLLDIWVDSKEPGFSSQRVLIGNEHNVVGIVTMADLLHYVFVNAHQLPQVMQVHALPALYPGTKTPSPIQEENLVEEDEKAWIALRKLVHTSCSGVLGIIDSLNGTLIGSMGPMDFLPSKEKNEVYQMVGSLNLSVANFTRHVCKNPTRMIDAVTFREQMTLEELIERLLKLRVHLLWRLGLTGHVIGMVTVYDILNYLKQSSR